MTDNIDEIVSGLRRLDALLEGAATKRPNIIDQAITALKSQQERIRELEGEVARLKLDVNHWKHHPNMKRRGNW